MPKLNIPHPCDQDFSKMTVTERGAFCEKCSTDTYSLYNKSIPEIKSILYQNIGKEICGRFAPGQMEAINAEFDAWSFRSKKSFQSAFTMSLIVVFGLSLFSCTDRQSEIELVEFQRATKEIVASFENAIDLTHAGEGLIKEPLSFQFDLNYFSFPINFPFMCNSWSMMPAGSIELPQYYQSWLGSEMTFPVPNPIVQQTDSVIIQPISDSVITEIPLISTEFSVLAFPNPTTGYTTVEYRNLEKARYKIDVYDLNGKHCQDVYSGKIDEAIFRQEINLGELPSGTYLVVIASRNFKESVRVIKN